MCRIYTWIWPERKPAAISTTRKSLVERADNVVEILDISRIRFLIDALEDELETLANSGIF